MKKNREKFDCVISLGYKCECAYSFLAMFGKIESCLFNWVHITDIYNLIKFLKNPDLLLSQGIDFDLNGSYMYKDNLLGFMYHSKHKPDYFQNGDIQAKIAEDKPMVYSRMSYLKDKFLSMIKSNKKNLFVLCFKKNVNQKEINYILKELSQLIYTLSGNKDSKILVIFERCYLGLRNIKKNNNVYIKITWKFSPDNFAHGINFEFWKNLYSNFEFAFCPNPDYKTNIENYIKLHNIGIVNIFGKKYAVKDKYYKKLCKLLYFWR